MSKKASGGSIWPKAIIAYFAVVIACMAVFVAWVIRQNNDLVRPDYYAEELRFQKQMDRVQRTQALSTQASVAYDPQQQEVTISVPREHIGRISSGVIHLYRPSDAKLDKNLQLELTADGKQRLDASRLESGLWKVRVFWKLNDEEFYFDNSILVSEQGV